MTDETPRAGVLAASPSELGTMRQAGLILEKFGVEHEIRIMSSSAFRAWITRGSPVSRAAAI